MREMNSDMMGDAMLEDNMMDCGVDAEGMEELDDLSNSVSDSTPTIREAAERLLTLLGFDELDDDFLSSEDEGVEVDLDDNEDEDEDDNDNELPNSRLLHQLSASLAEELKHAKIQSSHMNLKGNTQCSRIKIGMTVEGNNEQLQRMDITCNDDGYQTMRGQSSILLNKFGTNYYHNYQYEEKSKLNKETSYRAMDKQKIHSWDCDDYFETNKRCRTDEFHIINEDKEKLSENSEISSLLWADGWDSCATEAVRYLIDIEGLDPTHPTVLALKNHLEIQRNRSLLQYTT